MLNSFIYLHNSCSVSPYMMLADSQPIATRKKPGKSVKPRPRKREQSQSSSYMTNSIENMNPLSHHAATYTKPEDTTIEDYIAQKTQPSLQDTLPTSVLCRVAISDAVDDAYSYLFKHLKGQCHGLNVVTYPRVGRDDSETGEPADDVFDTVTRFAILAYIQPETKYRDWEEIEQNLVRIFKDTAEKEDGEEAKWRLDGVIFELWATAPMAWDLRSGHL